MSDGDIINIDVTPKLNGLHGDTSRMFYVGNVKSAKKMTPIGKFTDNDDVLKNVKPGDVLRLYEETT